MKRTALASAVAIALAFASVPAAQAATPVAAPTVFSPANPPAVWDLTPLYPSDAAWDSARASLLADLPKLSALQGTLGTSPASLLKAMTAISDARRALYRLDTYASLKADENTKIDANQARRQLSDSAGNQFEQATAFVPAEISAMGKDKVEGYLAAEPALGKFRYQLETMLRLAEHTLKPEQETLLAAAADPLDQPQAIYSLLTNADLPWPQITVRGKKYTLDQETYVHLRADRDPQVRAQVFKAFWPVYKAYERTIGAVYVAHLRGTVFNARARKFDNSLDMFLSKGNTPEAVYRTLVAETNKGLPTLHRYFKLRAGLLGLKQSQYSDIYVPLATPPKTYTLAEAEQLTLKAVAPLGPDYVDTLGKNFLGSWMHAVPQVGKRSGAYMSGVAYDVHPYVLTSFNGDYESVSTVAHEWGHAMHSVLANGAQPFETADYAIFIAEIPSTTNEMLLADYVAAHAKTKAEKVYALSQQLELLRGTFFRQAMFAEFELKSHEAIEKDQSLTGADLTKIYLDLLKRYHGDAEGVMHIDDLYGAEWEYIPHFYTDYYVYQYATSISAAAYFAEGIEKGDTKLRDQYFNMLKAGGSDDPYQIVKRAGLDMASPAPYQAIIARMNKVMDELDALTK
ncbi:oligoendopeptidase F [Amantichitinum ursilacus]|uniref:Oligopeptidase F n=1 Tax=Amantichitinum ursilacus TaxID=857265 RepID=A0A0N0GQH9_9NEIS|nr:oligoendopeptidase F [Amantichitinum ursilacus]KPC54802.1 Oligoendopeptidase F, plasmid [Amantichitinum ursilacus]